MNPGRSVKDRAGREMILQAEKRGELRPGGLVVESTAGNTGIGLALVADARGYRTLIVIPETQSQEKKDMLRLCGAELVEVPAVPYSNPNNYQHVGRRLADELRKTEPNGVIFADQWNNLDNRLAHYTSTGPEIWQQTDGKVDAFISLRRHRRNARRRVDLPARDEEGHRDRLRRSARRRDVQSVRARRGEADRRRLDHRRHRARPRDADHRRHQVREGLSHPRRGGDPAHLRPARARRACASAARRRSTSRARCGSRRISARARPSSRCSATPARAISRSCSIRHFLRSKNLPVPAWLERKSNDQAAVCVSENLMPTDCLFREDAYLTSTPATVLGLTEKGGIVVDRTCFYATSGGQPGDSGMLVTPAGEFPLATAVYNDQLKTEIAHVPADGVSERPAVGDNVTLKLDWGPRYRAHAHAHRAASSLRRAALSGDRRRGERGRQPARFRHSGGRARQGRDHREGQRDDQGGRRSALALDHRRRARSQSGPGENHVGEAADRHRPRAADRDRRLSTCSPAAARMCAAPAKSARCA